jgi:hypothetical protein
MNFHIKIKKKIIKNGNNITTRQNEKKKILFIR